MEPLNGPTRPVNPDIMEHEILEMMPAITTVDQHHDVSRHVDPHAPHGHHASPQEIRHHQELLRGDAPMLKAKIEAWRTNATPKHPIWQFFTHAHSSHDDTQSSPHLSTTTLNAMDVVCALCGAHIHQDHTLRKGEEESIETIRLARRELRSMWNHLASQCTKCPQNVRREMEMWRPLPRETLAEPVSGAAVSCSDTAVARSPKAEPGP